MIQVVGRAFGILERLAAKGPTSVKELAETTGLKKSTLCNILKTMNELGYVTKSQRGRYEVGPRLGEIARPQLQEEALVRLGREAVVALADATEETAQLAVLREGERYIVAEARCRQGLTVNTGVLGGSVFGSATGRVLLSGLGERELKEFVQRKQGASGEGEGSYRETRAILEEVREKGLSVYRTRDGQVVGVGAPVFGAGGRVEAALGVYLPSVRFRGSHRKVVIDALKKLGRETSMRLTAEVGK